jgi:S1-C subfamily serine protease
MNSTKQKKLKMIKFTILLMICIISVNQGLSQQSYKNWENKIHTQWDENKLREFWSNTELVINEGIYESYNSEANAKLRVAIKFDLDSNYYYCINLKENQHRLVGDIVGIIKESNKSGYFDFITFFLKTIYTGNKILFTKNSFNLINENDEVVLVYSKVFPSNSNDEQIISSGSGFALNSYGYIATNSHVVESAKNITVKGINGDFTKSYVAKLMLDDKTNDLAIIKITDKDFKSLGNIPYKISNTIMDVGSTVYALGYPMTYLLGEEIKYTNGSISSKTGFMGDITTYQMTTPIQGGNSGGPVFNSKGEVIGISNAKITKDNVDNVTYCIKTNYLLSLIDNLDPKIQLPTTNLVSTKTTPEQIKAIKNFVYIIEIR